MSFTYRFVQKQGEPFGLQVETRLHQLEVLLPDGARYVIQAILGDDSTVHIALLHEEGRPYRFLRVPVVRMGEELALSWAGRVYRFRPLQEGEEGRYSVRQGEPQSGRVRAPMVGVVSEVLVQEGDKVQTGQPLLALEAMKVVLRLTAPIAGTVRRLVAQPSLLVSHGDLLMEIEPSSSEEPVR